MTTERKTKPPKRKKQQDSFELELLRGSRFFLKALVITLSAIKTLNEAVQKGTYLMKLKPTPVSFDYMVKGVKKHKTLYLDTYQVKGIKGMVRHLLMFLLDSIGISVCHSTDRLTFGQKETPAIPNDSHMHPLGACVKGDDKTRAEQKITLDGAYLFYWADHCRGNYLDGLWTQWPYHRDLFRIWYVDGKNYNDGQEEDRDIDAWIWHVRIGRYSCEDMFYNPTTDGRSYWLKRSGIWDKHEIKWIKWAFMDAHPNDDFLQEKTTSYKYYFVPPDLDWTLASDSPGARTRGAPCNNDPSETDWWASTSGYVFETWETSGSSHKHYVGFYTTISVGKSSSHGMPRYIWIEMDGRATSNYAGSSVTNLYILVYNETWTKMVDYKDFYAGGTTNTGWHRKNYTIELAPSDLVTPQPYTILFCYSDGWSTCWYQHIYVKNIALNWYPHG